MKDQSTEMRRTLFKTEARKRSVLCTPQFVGSVLVVIGFFGPWVAHSTAALTVTGYELSEFAKFFPQVQGGTVPVRRGLFVTPLLAGVISLALSFRHAGRSPLLQLGASTMTALLALVALPPFQAILEPQYRLQLILVAGSVPLTIATVLARQLSEDVRGMLVLLLVLGGAIPALWQAAMLHPLVLDLYGRPVWPGWGLIASAIGFLILLGTGLRRIARS